MTTDLRSEATQLLDVLVDRLTATQQLLAGASTTGDAGPVGRDPGGNNAGGSDAGSGDSGEHATGAGNDGSSGADDADRASPICPTCGHDSREASCSGCPLCALLAMLRGERPELTAKLVDGALNSLQAIRGLLGPAPQTEPAVQDPARDAGEPPAPARIDIR